MTYMENLSILHRQGKIAAAYAYTKEDTVSNEEIRLEQVKKIESLSPLFNVGKYEIYTRCIVKPWTGYDVTSEYQGDKEEQIVYITEYGRVYHKSRNCTYLALSIQGISYQNIKEKRNQAKEKYEACYYCKNQGFAAIVYVTEYGNKYHTTTKCQGLKRSIESIPLSEIKEKECCKKCG